MGQIPFFIKVNIFLAALLELLKKSGYVILIYIAICILWQFTAFASDVPQGAGGGELGQNSDPLLAFIVVVMFGLVGIILGLFYKWFSSRY